jgi:protease IV
MTISSDILLYERNKNISKLNKWRYMVFILLLVLIFVTTKNYPKNNQSDFIAKVTIEGVIFHNPELIKKIEALGSNNSVKAIILYINSPGGTAFAGEELYIALKKLKAKKPVVSVLGTVAASGGYMVALGSDHIIARNMTITGSIGVILQSFEAVELANKLGIKFVSLKSSPFKATPNPFEHMDKNAESVAMEAINDSYDVFINIVTESRKMNKEQVIKLADGRIYSGLRAKKLNLVDDIGGEDEALNWLERIKNIPKNLKIHEINPDKENSFLEEIIHFFKQTNKMIEMILDKNNVILTKAM